MKRLGVNQRRVVLTHDRTGERFCKLHEHGAAKYRGAWLAANMAVTEHCRSRADVSDPAVKELLTLAVLRILMRLELEGWLRLPAATPVPEVPPCPEKT